LLEMVMWMLVLGERVQVIRRGAVALRGERDHLRSLAHTDALTGLLNRRGLDESLPSLLAASSPRSALAVYLMDLDGFKPVNDRHGHDTGDALLAAVGQRLGAMLRPNDLVCRLGGDEFVFAVGGLPGPEEAERVGRKVLKAFQQPFEVNGVSCRVGLTLGYAIAPHDDLSAAGLLKRADAAMYAGKQAGKNCLRRGAATAALAGA
jgi:diguanylate cyclase (GGDEF)-like protein